MIKNLVSIGDIEREASRLRRHLKKAQIPELRLLCGLRFFEFAASRPEIGVESYFREFVPSLAESARKSNPQEFLPPEVDAFHRLVSAVGKLATGVVHQDDLAGLQELARSCETSKEPPPKRPLGKGSIDVACLFVEYYPDLDLPPRGRLLQMQVTVAPISSRAQTDDVIVRNPTEEPDDRFLTQARDSVKAARAFLNRRFGLSLKGRFRFDFAVSSTGARLTGDSLGAAFAVGAVAAIGRIRVFPERLSMQPDAVLCGALSPDGKLASVDSDALKLKIYRAFHSNAKCLAVPADHFTEAKAYARELEELSPERKLEICGPETLDGVFADQRLVRAERLPVRVYLARRTLETARSARVQVPLLASLTLLLAFIIADGVLPPCSKFWGDCNPVKVRVTGSAIYAMNKDNVLLWSKSCECSTDPNGSYWKAGDLDGDGENEVAFVPKWTRSEVCETDDGLFVYDEDGTELFRRRCSIYCQYPNDCVEHQHYNPHGIAFFKADSEMVIVTSVNQSDPSRAHIKFWKANGDSLGWYINAGWASADERHFMYDKSIGCIFFGTNNRMHSACLFVLPYRSSFGASPPYRDPEWDLEWVTRGSQHKYLIFPRTDYAVFLRMQYNLSNSLTFEADTIIRVATNEDLLTEPATVLYYLNRGFRVIKATVDDVFAQRRNFLADTGNLAVVDWSLYLSNLQDSVTHWNDSNWVTEGERRTAEGLK